MKSNNRTVVGATTYKINGWRIEMVSSIGKVGLKYVIGSIGESRTCEKCDYTSE